MTEHVRTVHEGKKRIYKEVNCQVSFREREREFYNKMINVSALWENLSQEVGSEYPHILGPRGRHQCRGQAIRR